MRILDNQWGAPGVVQRFPNLLGEKLQSARKSCRSVGAAAAVVLLFSACASQEVGRPVEQMTRAETAIQDAIEAGAREEAPVELQTAQRHFSRAQDASSEEEYEEALRLAEKAEADAELAESMARSAAAYEAVAELQESIRILQEETERGIN